MISPSATSKHRGLHTEVKDPSQSAVLISEALSLLEQKAIEIIPRPDNLTWMMMFVFFPCILSYSEKKEAESAPFHI